MHIASQGPLSGLRLLQLATSLEIKYDLRFEIRDPNYLYIHVYIASKGPLLAIVAKSDLKFGFSAHVYIV